MNIFDLESCAVSNITLINMNLMDVESSAVSNIHLIDTLEFTSKNMVVIADRNPREPIKIEAPDHENIFFVILVFIVVSDFIAMSVMI